MATTAADRVFVDTNILVYATMVAAPLHASAQRHLRSLQRAGSELWLSRQILRELLATVTRPQAFAQPLPTAAAAAGVASLQTAFVIAEDGPPVMARLIALCNSVPLGGRQVYDANIVATMQTYAIAKLLTNNVADFARFQHLITVVPLVP